MMAGYKWKCIFSLEEMIVDCISCCTKNMAVPNALQRDLKVENKHGYYLYLISSSVLCQYHVMPVKIDNPVLSNGDIKPLQLFS